MRDGDKNVALTVGIIPLSPLNGHGSLEIFISFSHAKYYPKGIFIILLYYVNYIYYIILQIGFLRENSVQNSRRESSMSNLWSFPNLKRCNCARRPLISLSQLAPAILPPGGACTLCSRHPCCFPCTAM